MNRPRSDIQERLLAVALDVFSSKGVDGASLRAIAREADTNIGMVYYYFPTKDDLFLGVVEDVYESALERLEERLDPDRSFEERLEGLFGFAGTLDDHELRVVRVLVREALTSHERMEKLLDRFKRGHIPILVDLVGQGFREGKISRNHNPFVAMACLAGIGLTPHLFFRLLAKQLPQLGENPELPEKLPKELKGLYLRAFGVESEDASKEEK